jgi:uncharacterized protein YjbI with pentapeptide repeats
MIQRDTTGWAQSALLLLRKILRGILSPFLSASDTSVTLETPTNMPIVPETDPTPISGNLSSHNLETRHPDNPIQKVSSVPEPKSLEELFGIDVDGPTSPYQSSTSPLGELLGTETKVQPWTSTFTSSSHDSAESLSFNDLFGIEVNGQNSIPIPLPSNAQASESIDQPMPINADPIIVDPWGEHIVQANVKTPDIEQSQPLSPSGTLETSPMIDLSLDDNNISPDPQPEPLELEDTLINRASRGDLEAFRQLLNDELATHGVEVFDLESRHSLLQLSLCAEEVPAQTIIEPIIKTWVLNVGIVKVQKIELYGHRKGSELPHWRSEFNPSDLEYSIQSQDMGFETEQIPDEVAQYLSAIESGEPAHAETPVTTMDELWGTSATQDSANSLDHSIFPNFAEERVVEFSNDHPIADSIEEQDAVSTFLDDALSSESVAPGSEVENAAAIQKQHLVKEFLAQYAAGERSFIKIDLSEADLSEINLTLADLQEAQLVWANLQDASLYHVNLSGAKLRHANLNGAKLRSANLQGADFLNADLSHSDLTWSNLRGANLTGANLSNADLKNAILENVIMPDGTLLD